MLAGLVSIQQLAATFKPPLESHELLDKNWQLRFSTLHPEPVTFGAFQATLKRPKRPKYHNVEYLWFMHRVKYDLKYMARIWILGRSGTDSQSLSVWYSPMNALSAFSASATTVVRALNFAGVESFG